jgi:hypothetical protein
MKFYPELLREGIEDLAPGVLDEEIDELFSRAAVASNPCERSVRPKSGTTPFLGLMANLDQARTWVFLADALQDPDVIMLRSLSKRDRAKFLIALNLLEGWVSWDGALSGDVLVLPAEVSGEAKAIPLASLRDSGHRFALAGKWFAKTAMRISIEYRIQTEYALGFLMLDSLWRPMTAVGICLEKFGTEPRDARIHLDIDPVASDSEVLSALKDARSALGVGLEFQAKRDLRPKTVALALFLAYWLSDCDMPNEAVAWEEIMIVWNSCCEIDEKFSWTYSNKGPSGSAAYQFARDAKHALTAVRGTETKYPIKGKRKHNSEN